MLKNSSPVINLDVFNMCCQEWSKSQPLISEQTVSTISTERLLFSLSLSLCLRCVSGRISLHPSSLSLFLSSLHIHFCFSLHALQLTPPVWDQAAEGTSGPAGPGPGSRARGSHADSPRVGQTGPEFSGCRGLDSRGVWRRGRPEKPQGASCHCRCGMVSKADFQGTADRFLNSIDESIHFTKLPCCTSSSYTLSLEYGNP